jgi:hypothetical protein
MSPQFVDYDADGSLDLVAGIFDGSPHLARGSTTGWLAPQQILDRSGRRIVGNAFWNFDTKQWDATHAHDAPGHTGEVHVTSAIAFDVDGDGDLDLLLGDHRSGRVFVRDNEGSRAAPRYATTNLPLLAAGAPLDVPGTVATLRAFDWDRDGRLDLLVSGMGDAYADGPGSGVWLYPNTGTEPRLQLGAPIELVPASTKAGNGPTRPDAGLYADAGDVDGDGDFDLVVGGYSMWQPTPPSLDDAQRAKVAELQAAIAAEQASLTALQAAVEKAVEGLEGDAADRAYGEVYRERQPERTAIQQRLGALRTQLEPLAPGRKRESFVWLYERLPPPGK